VRAQWALYAERMNNPVPLVNWSIRLSETEVAAWDNLAYALRKEAGDRALTKSDIFRTLIELTNTPSVRAQLVDALRQRRAS
jgi:hypothetical protein